MVKVQVTRENVTTQNFVAAFLALFACFTSAASLTLGAVLGTKTLALTHRGVY